MRYTIWSVDELLTIFSAWLGVNKKEVKEGLAYVSGSGAKRIPEQFSIIGRLEHER